ncbi:hypothetical protein [Dysgonomonas sp.]|uniref:hypothetical protein n=1 Tax=Dysgonomonas sp. TaxID=1891233 RepID=UPI0027B87E5E|nr:hypothetical protein [Dysgonomonas sp.]
MRKTFCKSTTKEKCAMLLLSCMNWGCSNVHGINEFDSYDLVMSYNTLSEKILYEGCNEYMDRFFCNSISKKTELLTDYELTKFEIYNYEKLYKNDKLYSNYIKRIRQQIDSETHKGFDLNEFIADDLFALLAPNDYKLGDIID